MKCKALYIFLLALFACVLNVKAATKVPKDLEHYVIGSFFLNTIPEFRNLRQIDESKTTWNDLFNLNLNLLTEGRFNNKIEFAASIQVLSLNTKVCSTHYQLIQNMIKSKFSGGDYAYLMGILDKICISGQSVLVNYESAQNTRVEMGGMPSPIEFFDLLIKFTEKFPQSIKAALQKPLYDSKEILFKDTNPNYPGGGIGGANIGLINYISNLLSQDPQWIADSIQFYLSIYGGEATGDTNHGQVWDFSKIDYWKAAMEITDHDPWRAIRVLGVKGHDVCCNDLNLNYFQSSAEAKYFGVLLNTVSAFRNKNLYQPGSIAGIKIPGSIMKMFDLVKANSNRLGPPRYYRSANYHTIAGILLTEELLRKENEVLFGVRIPTFISDAVGYAYKRIRIESYLQPDAAILFRKGCKFEKCTKPKDWNDKRYQLAMLNLDENLAFLKLTAWQHRVGAKFAWKALHSSD